MNCPADRFATITIEDALNHPTWRMGDKITIDSATLMNKGLEVIEARWLFDLTPEQIDGRHPSAERHSFDGRNDRRLGDCGDGDSRHGDPGGVRSRLSRAPAADHLKPLSLLDCANLTFEQPDFDRFPCLRLAYEALRAGGTMPACLNAANEELVAGFLAGRAALPRYPAAYRNRDGAPSKSSRAHARGRARNRRMGAGGRRAN